MKGMFILFFCAALWAPSADAQVAVIANKSVPLNSIEQSELLDLFTGETSYWSNGEYRLHVSACFTGSRT